MSGQSWGPKAACQGGHCQPGSSYTQLAFPTLPAGSRVTCPIAVSSSLLPLPPDPSLAEMSTEGSKYINKEIKNALKGVKQIKTLIEQTNEERKSLLSNLEEAKKKKEVRTAR